MALKPLPAGIEQDQDIEAALQLLASVSGDASVFCRRIGTAQARYRAFTKASQKLGRDPDMTDLGPDLVASFLAQAKSLLDSRHLGMDAEVGCDSSDLRRERNKQVILEFKSESLVAAFYVHYLVSRIPEEHS
jgi:hypothetical protein